MMIIRQWALVASTVVALSVGVGGLAYAAASSTSSPRPVNASSAPPLPAAKQR